eukprot:5158682-Karenia_brevis.AAC.1
MTCCAWQPEAAAGVVGLGFPQPRCAGRAIGRRGALTNVFPDAMLLTDADVAATADPNADADADADGRPGTYRK